MVLLRRIKCSLTYACGITIANLYIENNSLGTKVAFNILKPTLSLKEVVYAPIISRFFHVHPCAGQTAASCCRCAAIFGPEVKTHLIGDRTSFHIDWATAERRRS